MVTIDAGNITLKDEGSGRWWKSELAPYRIGRYPVTCAQYADIVGSAPPSADDANKPVVEVSWHDALQFCNLLSAREGLRPCYTWDADGEAVCDWHADGYRLPGEAEWEFACRAGGNDTRYGELDAIAWYRDNSDEHAHAVGGKQPNAWGLYDMIGNVWEWCWDIYDAQIYGSYRVFRGGGWLDAPHACRASCRRKSHPTYRIDDLGFRLAQSVR